MFARYLVPSFDMLSAALFVSVLVSVAGPDCTSEIEVSAFMRPGVDTFIVTIKGRKGMSILDEAAELAGRGIDCSDRDHVLAALQLLGLSHGIDPGRIDWNFRGGRPEAVELTQPFGAQ